MNRNLIVFFLFFYDRIKEQPAARIPFFLMMGNACRLHIIGYYISNLTSNQIAYHHLNMKRKKNNKGGIPFVLMNMKALRIPKSSFFCFS